MYHSAHLQGWGNGSLSRQISRQSLVLGVTTNTLTHENDNTEQLLIMSADINRG